MDVEQKTTPKNKIKKFIERYKFIKGNIIFKNLDLHYKNRFYGKFLFYRCEKNNFNVRILQCF